VSTTSSRLPDNWLMVSSTALDAGTRLTRYARQSLDYSEVAKLILSGAVAEVDAAVARMRPYPLDGHHVVTIEWIRAVDQMAGKVRDAMKRDRSLAEDFAVDLEDWDLCVFNAPELRDLLGKRSLPINEMTLYRAAEACATPTPRRARP